MCCDCQDPRIWIPDLLQRLEQPCRHWVKALHAMHWVKGSAWWDGIWQTWTRSWGRKDPRVCPSIWPASWEHMFQEMWQPSHHIQVGKSAMQMDFILFCRTMHKLVTDVKVIPGKEVALQHQLLVCDMRINMPTKSKPNARPLILKFGSLKTLRWAIISRRSSICMWMCLLV